MPPYRQMGSIPRKRHVEHRAQPGYRGEVVFVHKGSRTLTTMFGVLPFKPFDYVVIPRTTTYQLDFDGQRPADLLIIEATGSVGFPQRYLNADGQLRLGAPFSERDLHG